MTRCTAQWKDFAAIAFAYGNVEPYAVASTRWHPNSPAVPTHLTCNTTNISVHFPVTYESGTTITRVRLKMCGIGEEDGLRLVILKRDESSTNSAWVTVGAEQHYTAENIQVKTYDVPDFTLEANYSYQIKIFSDLNDIGLDLYSVGIETQKRLL